MGESSVGAKPKLTLEEYSIFFDTMDRRFLSVDQLNQDHMLGLIETLDLVSLTRSTIQQGGASSRRSRLLVDELQRDMDAIGWGACRVGSVHTFGSSPVSVATPPITNDLSQHHRPNDVPPVAGKKRLGPGRRGRPPKTKKLPDLSPLFLIPLDSIFIENGGSF
ncbi:uncharacterized protein LOC120263462 isoform X3 [Dioscorea cayenensis subsp. rotundata]|uniref:Uncharacterized protein LOC120263462 isoform X3 n=1 Tax=Dioscorea cayennensis subsp. rotundata TaxID=55577 RepID=A0AB40BLS6_DIOCR|nr:uncharacterized protein LOC120263462 isoform X3 [Dioscorea cayenensis subsp. rotundata]